MSKKQKVVIVFGDVIIDEYTRGKPVGESTETPTIVNHLESFDTYLGGAALVGRNLMSLGADLVCLFSPGINPEVVELASHKFSDNELRKMAFFSIPAQEGYKCPKKSRFYSAGYKVAQYNREDVAKYTEKSIEYVNKIFLKVLKEFHTEDLNVVISDNGYGALNYNIAKGIITDCNKIGVKTYVDCQLNKRMSVFDYREKFAQYKNCDTLFLNENEYGALVTETGFYGVCDDFNVKNLVIKYGENGCLRFNKNKNRKTKEEGIKVQTIDPVGAGDALLAGYVYSGEDLKFANKWAAFSTAFKGTVVPKKEEFKNALL